MIEREREGERGRRERVTVLVHCMNRCMGNVSDSSNEWPHRVKTARERSTWWKKVISNERSERDERDEIDNGPLQLLQQIRSLILRD